MNRLALLDYGRFIAAMMVVVFHYTFNGIANGKIDSITHIPHLTEFTRYGYLGVELFYMISGYVIFHSARNRSAAQFAVSRAIRLYPCYWFAVLFTAFFAWQWAGPLMAVTPSQVLLNLTMLQTYLGAENVDGVYWTLVYELQFYALVFLMLLFGWQTKLDTFFVCWPVLMLVALPLGIDHLPYLGEYFAYFAAGTLFALLRGRRDRVVIASLLIAFFLCVSFSTGQVAAKVASDGQLFSATAVALIIAAFFAFFLIQNLGRVQSLRLPGAGMLGALTYPVYLIHAHFGYLFISRFANEENKVAIYLLTVAIVLGVAYAMHRIVEQALSRLWKGLFTAGLYPIVSALQEVFARLGLRARSAG